MILVKFTVDFKIGRKLLEMFTRILSKNSEMMDG